MISVILNVQENESAALARTLQNLISFAIDGLVVEVTLMHDNLDNTTQILADEAGCVLRPQAGGLKPVFDNARGDWLLFMEPGSTLEAGWADVVYAVSYTHLLRDEADASIAAYEQELVEAKAKAHEIGQAARDKVNSEAAAERQKVEDSLAEKLTEAEARIATIRTKAMSEVGGIAEETAAEIFTQLLGGKATKADLTKAVAAASK